VTDEGCVCVLDASALLALLHSEPGAEIVEEAVERAALSTVNWSEVYQRWLARGVDVTDLRADMEALGIEIVPFIVEDAEEAAELWSLTRQRGLSLGDRACLGLAGAPGFRGSQQAEPGSELILASASKRAAESRRRRPRASRSPGASAWFGLCAAGSTADEAAANAGFMRGSIL